MGQNSSMPVGIRRKSFRNSWRTPFPPRSRSRKGNLSATFNVLDIDTKIDQLNVNIASEEELMTLPGVSRADAHSIVEYRQRLGRFKKVEDLALVSGIGADKLSLIRPEICVGQRRSPSCASSRAQSVDSLPSVDKPSPRPIPLVNINTATVFELQTIPGFSQEIAANVVDYRDDHGHFKSLDQLTKVKGINYIRLGAVRSRLTVDTEEINTSRNGFPPVLNIANSTPKGSPKLTSSNSSQPIANGKITGHRKTMSVPIKFLPASNGLVVRDILDILSACSPRPIVEDHFDGKRRGRKAMRIATWNLSSLCNEKVENPGVKEVICRTILEYRFSLVSLQEVQSSEALEKLCNELNFPSLRHTKEWKENSRKWQHQSCEGVGFLWDSNDDVTLSSVNVINLLDSGPLPKMVHAVFKIGDFEISIYTIHIEESHFSGSRTEIVMAIDKALSRDQSNNQIVVGEFSSFQNEMEECSDLFGLNFKPVLPPKICTNSVPQNHLNPVNPFSDNIFLSKTVQMHSTGMSGLVRQGLTHLAIPRSWSWGGPASEHCPVWCEIFMSNQSI